MHRWVDGWMDGWMDDLSNTEECDYDGGDCCGTCVLTDYCSKCECLIDDFVANSNVVYNYIGDGICDDIFNIVECNFDGGDCCGSSANTENCTECECLSEESNGN